MSWQMLCKRSGAWTEATRRERLRSLSSDEINLGHDNGLVVLNVRMEMAIPEIRVAEVVALEAVRLLLIFLPHQVHGGLPSTE